MSTSRLYETLQWTVHNGIRVSSELDLEIYRRSGSQGNWGGAYHRGRCEGGDGVDGVSGEEEVVGCGVVRQLVVLDEVGAEQDVLGKPTDHEEVMMEEAALDGDGETIQAFDAQWLPVDR